MEIIIQYGLCPVQLTGPEMKMFQFAKSLDSDEVAHNEPPHLDLLCSPSSL